ncbi:MAG: heavy metal-associated domain-containing protein [Chloroflexi bacterium]|nr:heavy metal-associated domain-containing protein [Chloroflexota bacterium]
MHSLNFEIPNIGCAGCVQAIKNELTELEGVSSVNGDVGTRAVQIEFDPPATRDIIVAALRDIDYPPASA